jgi:serine/threonine-protein kinase
VYPQVFGKYVLEAELARGGMARVLLATLRGAEGFQKRLVVKQIRDELSFDQEFVRRFVQEAKTTVQLNHPNIVPVYELGVEQGTYYLTMELVEGVSAVELLRRTGHRREPLTPEEGAYVGAEVCRALDYAHRRMGVVHRDITPRNVMVDEEGQVRIIDFGIAARAVEGAAEAFGTLGHMPPEQMAGAEVTAASDIFALATVLMELWSGAPLYRHPAREEVERRMALPPPRPSSIDPRLAPLDEFVLSCLAPSPADRPDTAEAFGRILRKFLASADTADVAHRLGQRVRAVRQRVAETQDDPPPTRVATASVASYADMPTRTFAVREELASVSMSTRRLASTPPPKDASSPSATASDGAARASEVSHIESDPTSVGSDLATAPPRDVGGSRGSHRRRGVQLATGAAALLAVAISTAVNLRSRASVDGRVASATEPSGVVVEGAVGAREQGAPPVGAAPATPDAALPPHRAAGSAPSAGPSKPAASTHGVGLAKPGPSSTGTTTQPTETATAARARCTLLGTPGTLVDVDGSQRGTVPVENVELAPGSHTIRFSFAPTGESKTEHVVLGAGERITVRADFTSTVPTIHVRR